MSVKLMMAEILKRELITRGVTSLGTADCVAIVHGLLEYLTELELKLAAQGLAKRTD